jgi:hypothetical protein
MRARHDLIVAKLPDHELRSDLNAKLIEAIRMGLGLVPNGSPREVSDICQKFCETDGHSPDLCPFSGACLDYVYVNMYACM